MKTKEPQNIVDLYRKKVTEAGTGYVDITAMGLATILDRLEAAEKGILSNDSKQALGLVLECAERTYGQVAHVSVSDQNIADFKTAIDKVKTLI
jgi:hypothetical protein